MTSPRRPRRSRSSALRACALLIAGWLLLPGNEASALDLDLELGLFNRFTMRRNDVQRQLVFDVNSQTFATSSYLTPGLDDLFYSFLARASVTWRPRKWLGLALAVDSGELRPVGHLPRETTIGYTRVPPMVADVLGAPTLLTTEYRGPVTANGLPIVDEAKETYFIRQAFVRFQAPETEWLVVDVGRQESEVGGGLIYGDFGLGVRAVADLELLRGKPFRFSTRALLPSRSWTDGLRSPLVEVRAEYILSFMESIGLSVSYFHDGDDSFGSMLTPMISEAAVKTQPSLPPDLHHDLFAFGLSTGVGSRANIGWFGLDANKYFGDLQLSGSFVVEVGHLSLDNMFQVLSLLGSRAPAGVPMADTIEMSTLGFALDVSARYLITEKLAVGGFFLYLSGDGNPLLGADRSRFDTFLGVVPYLTQTNLFFSGGMNQTFSGRQATTAGINGRGVISGGLSCSWELFKRWQLGATAAVLFAQEPSITGGKFYGQETDLESSVTITDYLRVSVEYDVLWGGTFFPRSAPTHKLLVGLDLTYER